MKLWQIFVGIIMVFATIAGASATVRYNYTFDSDINGVESFGAGANTYTSFVWNSSGAARVSCGTYDCGSVIGDTSQYMQVGDIFGAKVHIISFTSTVMLMLHFCNETLVADTDLWGFDVQPLHPYAVQCMYSGAMPDTATGTYMVDGWGDMGGSILSPIVGNFYDVKIIYKNSTHFNSTITDLNTSTSISANYRIVDALQLDDYITKPYLDGQPRWVSIGIRAPISSNGFVADIDSMYLASPSLYPSPYYDYDTFTRADVVANNFFDPSDDFYNFTYYNGLFEMYIPADIELDVTSIDFTEKLNIQWILWQDVNYEGAANISSNKLYLNDLSSNSVVAFTILPNYVESDGITVYSKTILSKFSGNNNGMFIEQDSIGGDVCGFYCNNGNITLYGTMTDYVCDTEHSLRIFYNGTNCQYQIDGENFAPLSGDAGGNIFMFQAVNLDTVEVSEIAICSGKNWSCAQPAPTALPVTYYDYDTFTRADNVSIGLSEGLGAKYNYTGVGDVVEQITDNSVIVTANDGNGYRSGHVALNVSIARPMTIYANVTLIDESGQSMFIGYNFNGVYSENNYIFNTGSACHVACYGGVWAMYINGGVNIEYTDIPCNYSGQDAIIRLYIDNDICIADINGNKFNMTNTVNISSPIWTGFFSSLDAASYSDPPDAGATIQIFDFAVCSGYNMSCAPPIVLYECAENWTEYHVNITNCSFGMQTVMDLYFDQNSCNTTVYLPAENGTLENLSCSVPCVEDWEEYFVNQSCSINDSISEQKLYYDIELCNTTVYLPVDNGTIVGLHACNYCSESITSHFGALSECVLPQKLQLQLHYYIDSNYVSCCAVTSIASDCHIGNGSYANSTLQVACVERYTNRDLVSIFADGMGSAGAAFVSNLDLLITLGVMLGLVTVGAIAISRLKK